jgi:hypothetical protein
MSRIFGYFTGTRLATASSTSLSELDQMASLKETLDGLDALLNDDLVGKDFVAGLNVQVRRRFLLEEVARFIKLDMQQ